MSGQWAYVFLAVAFSCITESSNYACRNAMTSEGPATLKHGQTACAPLTDGENAAVDKGRRFVTCSYGRVVTQFCPGGLRFDTRSGNCIWPRWTYCRLPKIRVTGTPATRTPVRTTPWYSIQSPKRTTLENTYLTNTTQYTEISKANTMQNPTNSSASKTTQSTANSRSNTTLQNATKNPTIETIYPSIKATQNYNTIDATRTMTTSTTSEDFLTELYATAIILSADETTSITGALLQSLTVSTTSGNTASDAMYPPLSLQLVPTSTVTLQETTTIAILPEKKETQLSTSPEIESTTPTLIADRDIKAITPLLVADTITSALVYETEAKINVLSEIEATPITSFSEIETLINIVLPNTTLPARLPELAATTLTKITITTQIIDTSSTITILPTTTSTTVIHFNPESDLLTSNISLYSDSLIQQLTQTPPSAYSPTATTATPLYFSKTCSGDTCQLPDCSCFGARPNISILDTPMFVTISFSGSVTPELYNNYLRSLLVDNNNTLYNPSGCPLRATVFLTDAGTDYQMVRSLAAAGHEIASLALTNSLPVGDSNADYEVIAKEVNGIRKKVPYQTGNQEIRDSIVGFRAPNLRIAHDMQYEVMRDYNFLYDSSISSLEIYANRSPIWPFTLDYPIEQCPVPPCPTKTYPGMWEVPINAWLGSDGNSCSFLDNCNISVNVSTVEEQDWFSFYKKNFETYFYPVKVPIQVSTRGSMFTSNNPSFPAMIRWLQDLLTTHTDVWLVTSKMVIDWMKNPLTNSQMFAEKWGCQSDII